MESFEEQLSRLREMSSGDNQTWDLSTNDCAAIGAVCNNHEALLAALKGTLDYWETTGFAECEKDCDCVVDIVRAAIAKAEQQ